MRTTLSKCNKLFHTSKYFFGPKTDLKAVLREQIPIKQKNFNDMKKSVGDKVMGEITVNQVLGGMRGIRGLFYD